MRRVMTVLVLSAVAVIGTGISAWAEDIPIVSPILSKASFG